MQKGAERMYRLSESQAIAMTRKARELREQGKNIINLSIGEPDFDTPAPICEAAIEAIKESFTHYPPVSGIPSLREAAANKFRTQNNLPYRKENIVVSCGAKHSLANAILSLVNPGEEVIIPAPYWITYTEIVKLAEGVPVFILTRIGENFKITPRQLEAAISPRSKVFLFSSPCNPSGTVYTREELIALGNVLKKNPDIFVISDEIYEHINYGVPHYSMAQDPELFERSVTVNGVSKCYAMTGWRIGYLGAPKWIAELCDKLQGQFTSGATSISQRAALAALNMDMSPVYEMRDLFRKRRDLVLEKMKSIPFLKSNVPMGAFYIFPEISSCIGKQYNGKTIRNSHDLCLFLLEEAQVTLVEGEAFGAPGHIRISYATGEKELSEAMERIRKSLEKLQ